VGKKLPYKTLGQSLGPENEYFVDSGKGNLANGKKMTLKKQLENEMSSPLENGRITSEF